MEIAMWRIHGIALLEYIENVSFNEAYIVNILSHVWTNNLIFSSDFQVSLMHGKRNYLPQTPPLEHVKSSKKCSEGFPF